MIFIYQNYVKSGYIMMVTMHTQGLKSFARFLVRCILLDNIRQPHQKIKFKTKDMLDKMNNKISAINKTNEGLAEIKADLTKKLNLIYELMTELQDEIYSDDSWLRLVESDTIDAIAEEAFNIVWKVLYEKKNRINAEMIMIVKHKDIDGYVSELAVQ